jgi:aminoglycoside 6-adenylyltransferase
MFDLAEWTRLEKAFVTWAETQPAVYAALVVGSRARIDPPPDDWSDLDVMIFASNPKGYLQRQDWLSAMGEVWNAVPNMTAGGDPEWLVTYANGYNVDFVLLDVGSLEYLTQTNALPDPFARGYRILIDKDGQAAKIPPAPGRPVNPPLPSPEEFARMVNSFWYAAFYVAKQIRRGEMFMVKVRDGNMKEMLLGMLSWHALAVRGPQAELWHLGRYMERWADEQAVKVFPAIFAHYEAADSWRALDVSTGLFRRIAIETAEKLNYEYPMLVDERMSKLVDALQTSQ